MISKARVVMIFSIFFLMIMAAGDDAETYSVLKEFSTGIFGSIVAPTDIAIAPDGTLYVADTSNSRILQFDPYGSFQSRWTSSSNFLPQGIGIDASGNVYYVTNFFDQILKFSATGGFQLEWGSSGDGNGQFDAPSGIDVGPDGSVYVADTDNHRIQKFDPNGNFIRAWGSPGNEEGEFRSPKAVAVDGQGIVLVTDTDNNRVQAFDPNGTFIAQGGSQGTGPLEFDAPEGIAIGPDGSIYVADTMNKRIQRVGLDGSFAQWGSDTLSNPTGLTIDRGGNVYVADNFGDRVVVFKPDVFIFENGAASKVIGIPQPFTLSFDVRAGSYWSGVPAEVFVWLETLFQGLELKFYLGPEGDFHVFNAFTEMMPLIGSLPVPAALDDVKWQILSSTAGLPAIDLTFFLCLDRNINGVYNPADSTCDNILVNIQ